MKKILIIICLFTSSNVYAQNFDGHYVTDSFESEFIQIKKDSTYFILGNALNLYLKNIYKKDTVYCYLVGEDVAMCYVDKFKKWQSGLFIKMYFIKGTLRIKYINKNFIKDTNYSTWHLPKAFYKHL